MVSELGKKTTAAPWCAGMATGALPFGSLRPKFTIYFLLLCENLNVVHSTSACQSFNTIVFIVSEKVVTYGRTDTQTDMLKL